MAESDGTTSNSEETPPIAALAPTATDIIAKVTDTTAEVVTDIPKFVAKVATNTIEETEEDEDDDDSSAGKKKAPRETYATASSQPPPAPSTNDPAGHTYTDDDGVVFEWDAMSRAWFPRINEDFMAAYQQTYGGYTGDEEEVRRLEQVVAAEKAAAEAVAAAEEAKKAEKSARKGPQKREWFDVSQDDNTHIYISNLPSDITEEELLELASKCGFVMNDPLSRKPRMKLYRDEDGTPKGDAKITFIKKESVQLALQILDGYRLRGNELSVERATFTLKGEYDPTKRRKLTNKEKRKAKKAQESLFEWRPELRGTINQKRPKFEKVCIIKSAFSPKDFEADPQFYDDIKADFAEGAAPHGTARKVVVCDRHPAGVVMIFMTSPQEADSVMAAFSGRGYAGRNLTAELWDGKTKYQVAETEEERVKRVKQWEDYLEGKANPPADSDDRSPPQNLAAEEAARAPTPPSDEYFEGSDDEDDMPRPEHFARLQAGADDDDDDMPKPGDFARFQGTDDDDMPRPEDFASTSTEDEDMPKPEDFAAVVEEPSSEPSLPAASNGTESST